MNTVRLALEAMATRFELVLHGEDDVRLRAAGEEALAEIQRLDAQLSFYRPSSEISRINARAAAGPVRVEPRLFRLLQTARRLHTETGGAFDLTVAPLMRCWGFTGNTGRLPEPEALAEARRRTGMHLVTLDEADFRKVQPIPSWQNGDVRSVQLAFDENIVQHHFLRGCALFRLPLFILFSG